MIEIVEFSTAEGDKMILASRDGVVAYSDFFSRRQRIGVTMQLGMWNVDKDCVVRSPDNYINRAFMRYHTLTHKETGAKLLLPDFHGGVRLTEFQAKRNAAGMTDPFTWFKADYELVLYRDDLELFAVYYEDGTCKS